jgi:peroxiredoxin
MSIPMALMIRCITGSACILMLAWGCGAGESGQALPGPAATTQEAASSSSRQMGVPEVAWYTLDGKAQTPSAYRGSVMIVDFWATWCGPCKVAIPDLNDLYRTYKDQGLVIVGVSMDKLEPEAIREFVTQYRMAYPIVRGDRTVEEAFGQVMSPPQNRVTSLPTTFIVDRKGRVIKHYVGYKADLSRQELEADIKELL